MQGKASYDVLGSLVAYISAILQNLSKNTEMLKARLKIMIDEGVIMGLSMIISRLTASGGVATSRTADIFNPILVETLIILEDISSFDEEEEQALLDSNVVARVMSVLDQIISILSLNNVAQIQSQQEQAYLF